ncbi:hypothetical protein BS17DRAFT_850254 [Gyrodon lividus]|nr:hypothetical protein BS17DRAFT_850254 [Gyrodon lividus]
MRRELIRAVLSWKGGPYGTIACMSAQMIRRKGCLAWIFHGFTVFFFFSFVHTDGQAFLCAVVRWFNRIVDEPGDLTGMWMVAPS